MNQPPSARLRGRLALKIITALVIILVAGLAALPFLAPQAETRVMDGQARAGTPGEYVALGDGIVHYEIAGPENAPAVVLIHGFSTPYFIWDGVFPAVVDAGYRAVRYDLYGRGWSDRPTNLDYDADLFDRQLMQLIEKLELKTPLTLAGVSMGGAISVIFAARHPELVRGVILVDPAGFPLPLPATAKLIRFPGVGEYLMRLLGDRTIRQGMATNFHDPAVLEAFAKKFEPQLQYEGFQYAQLSTLRHMPMQSLEAEYRALGESGKPVLLVWGKQDQVIPFATHEKVLAAVPQAELLAVDDAGHVPQYETPEAVNPSVLEFLRKHAGAEGDERSQEKP